MTVFEVQYKDGRSTRIANVSRMEYAAHGMLSVWNHEGLLVWKGLLTSIDGGAIRVEQE